MAAVRQYRTEASGSNPDTFSFSHDVFAGSTLFLLSLSSVTTEAITGITDDDGNAWTEAFDQVVGAVRLEIWRAPSGAAGSLAVTVTWSAHTAAKRIWQAEALSFGSLSNGSNDTHEVAVAEDPMTLASLTASGNGIAFWLLATDSAHTLTGWTGTPFVFDMGSGTAARAGFAVFKSGESLAATLNCSTTESGDSMVMEFLDSGGGGGGAHSFAFFG